MKPKGKSINMVFGRKIKHRTGKAIVISLLVYMLLVSGCLKPPSDSGNMEPEEKEVQGSLAYDFTNIGALDQNVINSFLDQMTSAYKAKDLSFLKRYLASDAVLFVKQGGKEVKVNKEQYLALLAKAWKKIRDYNFKKGKPSIAIQGNAASVSLLINESGKIMGRRITIEVITSLEIKLVNGIVLIKKVTGRSKVGL